MTDDRYRYTGSEMGTELRNDDYEIVTRGPENIVLQRAHSIETVEMPKEEFDEHVAYGRLKPVR
jgi:hypothetical protein